MLLRFLDIFSTSVLKFLDVSSTDLLLYKARCLPVFFLRFSTFFLHLGHISLSSSRIHLLFLHVSIIMSPFELFVSYAALILADDNLESTVGYHRLRARKL